MTESRYEKSIKINDEDFSRELYGDFDRNIKLIEEEFDIDIVSRQGEIKILGKKENVELVDTLIKKLIDIVKVEGKLTNQQIRYAITLVYEGKENKMKELLDDTVCVTYSGKTIKPKTLGQKRYIDSMAKNDLVFGIGPAGTGKTYLAVAKAVQAFKNKEVERIILTRPAVEAGEKLGFLPGDLQDKVDPYLRPVYDALFDIFGGEAFLKNRERGLIEIAPLAYMRGRTLDSAFVILDEAQNTTSEQMKMFLTRLGFGSKAIITGDITQVDLPYGKTSGLKQVTHILKGVKGIDFIYLSKQDVVRHKLVQRIIEAYENHEKKKK
ncbi:PhoH family protein [Senegalia massiliensis]|uniref:PhoH-like protein n=1 Tax=Senegalia massiliensis TaxID=1720316 RepID=A0A845QYF8_9CLOT|nr:PhoH family protein [Senegalia massiliensis]NBI07014.1 PhoH family protein [Senegalia massiliensis]